MIPIIQNFQTILLANGAFPTHDIPLSFIKNAKQIICCDGSVNNLLLFGMEPDYIVGDLDSLADEFKVRYSTILHHDPDQETNDLTKAVHFCIQNGWKEITILGATGKREDHTLGNISLLADYEKIAKVQLLTDYGVFVPISKSTSFESFKGQQVSIFSLTPETLVTTHLLRYPLNKSTLSSWWQGSLNETLEDHFKISMDYGNVLIFRKFR